ncbi:MAG TPA: hypothetical protein EYP21_04625 [Syntrophaceae bacterium]|nr:hypothetical protein [Syntrophaceae bacterium]
MPTIRKGDLRFTTIKMNFEGLPLPDFPLESGVDLRYMQEILGHKSSKTTEIYTYVSTKNLSSVINPLDNILDKKRDDRS